jgi:hypothetical protein
MEYYLCEFEYSDGYSGEFYQVVYNGNVVDYVDLNNNKLILEGSYGYHVINSEPITPSWV